MGAVTRDQDVTALTTKDMILINLVSLALVTTSQDHYILHLQLRWPLPDVDNCADVPTVCSCSRVSPLTTSRFRSCK